MLSTPAERLLDDLFQLSGVEAVLLIDGEGLCTETRPHDLIVGAERRGLLGALSAEAALDTEYEVLVASYEGGGCLISPLDGGRSLCAITGIKANVGAVRKGLIDTTARLRPLIGR